MKGMRIHEKGAVSLFIVIFSAILITTITVAFVRIMVQNQQQATTNDLSQSALDSAYAGVEDAKRAIIAYRNLCGPGGNGSLDDCEKLKTALTGTQRCDTIQRAGILNIDPDAKEVIIEQEEGDELLNQAYTCVKVWLNTDDYVGSLVPNTSRLIPLKSEENKPFDTITIRWFSQEDLQTADPNSTPGNLDCANLAISLCSDAKLPKLADWPSNRPALLRVQLIQFGKSFMLSDFDKNEIDEANTATLFLMPSTIGRDKIKFTDDYTSGALQQVLCDENFSVTSDEQYACEAIIKLPKPVNMENSERTAFLRINTIYNTNTTFQISMTQGNDIVKFSSVQPIIDSTGRANDLFRRIKSRVELEASSVPYAEAAVDVTGNICKTFLVTNSGDDYNSGRCGNN